MNAIKLDNRIWIVITVVICAALFAGGWFVGVDPRLKAVAAADLERSTVLVDNDATRAQVENLKVQSAKLPELQSELSELQAQVPPGVQGSAFISSLDEIAVSSGATIDSFSLSSPVAYAPVVPDAATTQVGPAVDGMITPANFIIVPITLAASGSQAQVLDFLAKLQSAKRVVLLTEITNTKGDGDNYSLNLVGSIFVLRNAQAEADAAAAAAGTTATDG